MMPILATLTSCTNVKTLPKTAWILLFALWAGMPVHAAFEDSGTGARPTALGGTYVALGDDTQSLMVNPAGLAKMDGKEVTSEYTRLYMGLSDGSNISQYFLAYGQRIKYGGTVALGWKQLTLDDLYQERTVSLGYGEWITQRIAVGFALKQLYHAFGIPSTIVDNSGNVRAGTPDFFIQNGNSNTAYSADLGMLFKATPRHTVGISIQDINEPNIALSNAYRRLVNRTIRMGMAYQATANLTLGAALTARESLDNQTDKIWSGSAERWWKNRATGGGFGLRGSLTTGSRSFQQVALGPAWKINSLQLDYATVFNLSGITLGETAGTHRLSMSYRFGETTRAVPVMPTPKPRLPKPKVDSDPTMDSWLESLGEGTMPWDLEEKSGAQAKPEPKTQATPETTPMPKPAITHEPAVIPVKARPQPTRDSTPNKVTTGLGGGIPATYVVQNGDTLMSIAQKFYGDPEQWRAIYSLNSDRLGTGGFLTPGKVLVLPRKDQLDGR